MVLMFPRIIFKKWRSLVIGETRPKTHLCKISFHVFNFEETSTINGVVRKLLRDRHDDRRQLIAAISQVMDTIRTCKNYVVKDLSKLLDDQHFLCAEFDFQFRQMQRNYA